MRRWRVLKEIEVVGLKVGDIVYAIGDNLYRAENHKPILIYPPDHSFWSSKVWEVRSLNFNDYYEAIRSRH